MSIARKAHKETTRKNFTLANSFLLYDDRSCTGASFKKAKVGDNRAFPSLILNRCASES